jgi:hypothetical protein
MMRDAAANLVWDAPLRAECLARLRDEMDTLAMRGARASRVFSSP